MALRLQSSDEAFGTAIAVGLSDERRARLDAEKARLVLEDVRVELDAETLGGAVLDDEGDRRVAFTGQSAGRVRAPVRIEDVHDDRPMDVETRCRTASARNQQPGFMHPAQPPT